VESCAGSFVFVELAAQLLSSPAFQHPGSCWSGCSALISDLERLRARWISGCKAFAGSLSVFLRLAKVLRLAGLQTFRAES